MPVANQYPNGASFRMVAIFRTRNADQSPGALTNPTTVTFSYENPNGTEVVVVYPTSIVRPATGIYYLDVSLNVVGTWRYRMDGDGTVYEGTVECVPSVFA